MYRYPRHDVTRWWIYIIRSQTTDRLYTGIALDPIARLSKHNKGKGAKCTRAGRPWRIVYLEEAPNKSLALRRECEIKRLSRAEKLGLIECTALEMLSPTG